MARAVRLCEADSAEAVRSGGGQAELAAAVGTMSMMHLACRICVTDKHIASESDIANFNLVRNNHKIYYDINCIYPQCMCLYVTYM